MKNIFSTKRICRAGVIAALYVALTCSFGMLGYVGMFQIRPAEALCILPLFYPEAVPALYLGCMLANVISLYGVYDIFVGSLVTLVAALFTFAAGKIFRESRHTIGNHIARVGIGGFFPVILNAAIVPVVIVYLAGFADGFETAVAAYGWNFLSLLISQSVWIYALGTPLYLFVTRMRQRNISVFLDGKKKTAEPARAES